MSLLRGRAGGTMRRPRGLRARQLPGQSAVPGGTRRGHGREWPQDSGPGSSDSGLTSLAGHRRDVAVGRVVLEGGLAARRLFPLCPPRRVQAQPFACDEGAAAEPLPRLRAGVRGPGVPRAHTTQPASVLPPAPGLGPHVCTPRPVWTDGLGTWSPPAASDRRRRRCRGPRGHEVGRPRARPRSLQGW